MSRLGSLKQLELQNRVRPMDSPVKAYKLYDADTLLLGCARTLRSRCSYTGVFSTCIQDRRLAAVMFFFLNLR